MSFETIRLELDDKVARIEFQRPEHYNAFNAVMHREFKEALEAVRDAEEPRVLLLEAQGKAFLGGGDFQYMRQLRDDPDLRRRTADESIALFSLLNQMPVPIIAAMHGHALGFGATIVTSCDMVVAYAEAKLGDPHVRAGIVAGDGSVLSWSAAAGVTRAKRMLLTGDTISAREAHTLGLITDVVERADQVQPAARALAERIAALPPLAIRGTKRAFNALAAHRNGAVIEVSVLAEIDSIASDDLEEALQAAEEKRPGQYCGR